MKKSSLFGICFLHFTFFLFLFLSTWLIYLPTSEIQASSQPHYTLFINQVRGIECCDVGSVQSLNNQLDIFEKNDISASFAIRYDVLSDSQFSRALNRIEKKHEAGGFLEITPQLAADAGVEYDGDETTWYQAQNSYLIGYEDEERKKLIDTYMTAFQKKFARYPRFTTAWMIDPYSLKYLSEQYGVKLHQITREQFGTDSYTLYGGPPHYPYYPSENWSLIPDADQESDLPLVVRQTTTDPVHNYGDTSNSFTSQPNDYMLRNDNIAYFQHIFNQAHSQPNDYTFSLLGLENSMPIEVQDEFERQITLVGAWQENDEVNTVLTASEFADIHKKETLRNSVQVYRGISQDNPSEKAWWITTSTYRVRVRLSDGELFISDIRLYDEEFKDPYMEKPAERQGWWIIPFVLDGSRFFHDVKTTVDQPVVNDTLIDRKDTHAEPSRIHILDVDEVVNVTRNDDEEIEISEGKFIVGKFSAKNFEIFPETTVHSDNETVKTVIDSLYWSSKGSQRLWGFSEDGGIFTPEVKNPEQLQSQRDIYPYFLFPEVKDQNIDVDQSYILLNNQFAIAGRNPVRLVFFPRNKVAQPVYIASKPKVFLDKEGYEISVERPSGSNGMVFVDIASDAVKNDEVEVAFEDFTYSNKIYFAPNCLERKFYCLAHPRKAWWYLRTVWDDRQREREQLSN